MITDNENDQNYMGWGGGDRDMHTGATSSAGVNQFISTEVNAD